MRKEEFEKRLVEEGRKYTFNQHGETKFCYKFENLELWFIDGVTSGIRLSNRDSNYSGIGGIYCWSDAFDLAYRIVEDPDQYNQIVKQDLNQSLDRVPFQFEWKPQKGIQDFSDGEIKEAVRQVKSGCIHSLTCSDEKFVVIDGTVSGYMKTQSQSLTDVLSMINLSEDNNSESNVELQNDGMLALCGYLYYSYVNGGIDDNFKERESVRCGFRKVSDPFNPYQFTWETKNGLKLIPENIFQLALLVAKRGIVHAGKELTENNRIMIYYSGLIWANPYVFIKNRDMTMCLMTEEACTMTPKYSKEKFFEIRDGDDLLTVECPLDVGKSIYYCACYICYLRETGREEKMECDRDWYHDHNKGFDTPIHSGFSFELPNDLFLDLSLPFELAELLQERNYVSLCRKKALFGSSGLIDPLQKEVYAQSRLKEEFCIRTREIITKNNNLETIWKEVKNGEAMRSKGVNIPLSDFSEIYNNETSIGLRCVYLAAYIDYLRRTGQYEAYKEKRQMSLATIQIENPALQKLLSEADHKDKASIYCVIEGERTVGKREIIDLIAARLEKSGKIDAAKTYNYSFAYTASMISKRDRFDQRKLYVLSDLREFLTSVEDSDKKDKQLKDADIASLIKHLGRYQPETYIIVVCEEQYARQFLQLSAQIQLLFGENVIPIENLPPERMYDIYREELSEDLKVQLLQDNGYKDRFVNYIAENRGLFPIDNQELAEYLAGRSNNENSLELPSVRPSAESLDYEKQLSQFVGMENIKKKMRDLAGFMNFQRKAAKQGSNISAGYLHMIFVGNPGTGKTTIAKIMADMLYSIGIIKTNKLVSVERKDLVGEYIGHTGPKTSEVIQKALDGVLFIDEAYSLASSSERDFGAEAITTLIDAMVEYKDRLVVIFAGYKEGMDKFVDSNPGIRSRIGYEFYFEDYSPEELTEMFSMKLEKQGFTVEKDALDQAYTVFDYFSKRKNFGNGRFVDELIQETYLKHAGRLSDEDPDLLVFRREDIPEINDLMSTGEKIEKETTLEDVVGLRKVREELKKFDYVADFWQESKRQRKQLKHFNMNMVFYGNPGTGKSTIARIAMEDLYSRGLIQEHLIKEVNAKDLRDMGVKEIYEAKGGLLLIDDAELLTAEKVRQSGLNALDLIIKSMEEEDFIVIFAGRKENIKKWISSVPRLAENIRFYFDFEDCSPKELCEIYVKKMKECGFLVSEEARETVTKLMQEFSCMVNFENGRFVDRVIQETFTQHAQTCREENFGRIEADDIPSSDRMKSLINNQVAKKMIGFTSE